MQATWNVPAHLKIIAFFWASLALNGLLVMAAFNNWFEFGWPIYLTLLCSTVLYIISAISNHSKHVSVSLTDSGLSFCNDAKNYRVSIPKDDIKAIRIRNYLLLKTLVIDIKDNQRLTLSNALIPAGFPA